MRRGKGETLNVFIFVSAGEQRWRGNFQGELDTQVDDSIFEVYTCRDS